MMLNREALEAATRSVKEAFSRYYVEGTSDDDLHSPPYRAPWHLIDTSTAEPEVNWPGELIQEYDNPQAAYDHRERLAAQAAIKAYLTALPDEGAVFPSHFWALANRWASTSNNDRKAKLASEMVDLIEAWHADEAARAAPEISDDR